MFYKKFTTLHEDVDRVRYFGVGSNVGGARQKNWKNVPKKIDCPGESSPSFKIKIVENTNYRLPTSSSKAN